MKIPGIKTRLETAKNIYNDELMKLMMMEGDLRFLEKEQLSPSASDQMQKYMLEVKSKLEIQKKVVNQAMETVLDLIQKEQKKAEENNS